MKMLNLNNLKKSGLLIYIFVYLIFSNFAIAQGREVDIVKDLENALNMKYLKQIENNFKEKEIYIISKKFKKLTNEFPDLKWIIKEIETNSGNNLLKIKVFGEKKVNDETYLFESQFNYLFSMANNKINQGRIKNLLTTIRSDQNKIDITFKIPNKVLSGTKYDIDIILNEPLGETIVAGGIKSHQDDSFIKEDIIIEPLVSGGIFKTTRAPSKKTTQLWSGVIVHPDGMVSFTKSVDIVEEI